MCSGQATLGPVTLMNLQAVPSLWKVTSDRIFFYGHSRVRITIGIRVSVLGSQFSRKPQFWLAGSRPSGKGLTGSGAAGSGPEETWLMFFWGPWLTSVWFFSLASPLFSYQRLPALFDFFLFFLMIHRLLQTKAILLHHWLALDLLFYFFYCKAAVTSANHQRWAKIVVAGQAEDAGVMHSKRIQSSLHRRCTTRHKIKGGMGRAGHTHEHTLAHTEKKKWNLASPQRGSRQR